MRLAIAQTAAEMTSARARVDWLAGALPELQRQGAQLVVLPELFLCGYFIGAQIVDRAEPSDGPYATEISALARRYGMAIHYGYSERSGDRFYNAAQCFGPDGQRLGGHRKLIFPPGFEADHFTPGAGCEVFDYCGLKVGMLICYDTEFPETMRHVTLLGAELVLVPTALAAKWRWVADMMIPTRAFENAVFLAYANHSGHENGMDYLGGSFFAAPDGEVIARAGAAPEILIVEIDPARLQKAQRQLPYLADRLRIDLAQPTQGQ
jgi:predicted amidohydrolase